MIIFIAVLASVILGFGLLFLEQNDLFGKKVVKEENSWKKKTSLELEHELLEEFGIVLGSHKWECPDCVTKQYIGAPAYWRHDPRLWADEIRDFEKTGCYILRNGDGLIMSTRHRSACACRKYRNIVKNAPKADFIDGEIIEFPRKSAYLDAKRSVC